MIASKIIACQLRLQFVSPTLLIFKWYLLFSQQYQPSFLKAFVTFI